jgi:hypothetical protein
MAQPRQAAVAIVNGEFAQPTALTIEAMKNIAPWLRHNVKNGRLARAEMCATPPVGHANSDLRALGRLLFAANGLCSLLAKTNQ